MKSMWSVIKGPIITEKALQMKEDVVSYGRKGNDRQLLAFRVAPEASKPEIRNAIEKIFGVKVDSVRTVNYPGKTKRVGRHVGRRTAWKKAYVTITAGEKQIEFDDVI